MRNFIIVILILLFEIVSSQVQLQLRRICEDASENCQKCIQAQTYCNWCYKADFDKPRCNLLAVLNSQDCEKEFIIENPGNSSLIERQDKNFNDVTNPDNPYESVQIKPQKMKIKLRKGHPFTFQMKYRLAKNYPLDLYYLMDLTYSMEQDVATMTKLGTQLTKLLQDLTEHYSIAFGYYSDKVAMPFAKMTNTTLENPCISVGRICRKPFDFVHSLNFTKNIDKFIEKVESSKTTANLDNLEGALDALYQIMLCQDYIKWRQNSRKIIVIATDGIIHSAGDGILAGAVKKVSDECLLDSNGIYSGSLIYDYPSLGEIYRKLLESKMNVLFASKTDSLPYYRRLNKAIPEVSFIGELKEKSENVLNLVREGYFHVVNTVKFSAQSDNIAVKFSSSCNKDIFESHWNDTDTCDNVEEGQEYTFNVTLELKNLPSDKTGETLVIEEQNISENLTIEVEYIGKCSCQSNLDNITAECSNNGVKDCGVCLCNEGWKGTTCEESCIQQNYEACREKNNEFISTTCHGRGDCECGKCICDPGYTGSFCQFRECSRGENDLVCSGESHGVCYNGECICTSEYSGEDCSCLVSQNFCIAPNSEEVCSGIGFCKCGKCQCPESYKGAFCEKCSNCTGLCSTYQECVIATSSGDNSRDACTKSDGTVYTTNFLDEEINDDTKCFTQYSMEGNLICTIDYVYEIRPDHVVKLDIYRYECIKGPNPVREASIVSGIIVAVILGLGTLGLLMYKLNIRRKDRIEYERFNRERATAKMSEEENPLYNPPIRTYQMPIELRKFSREEL